MPGQSACNGRGALCRLGSSTLSPMQDTQGTILCWSLLLYSRRNSDENTQQQQLEHAKGTCAIDSCSLQV